MYNGQHDGDDVVVHIYARVHIYAMGLNGIGLA
jgi:hypothetical protein